MTIHAQAMKRRGDKIEVLVPAQTKIQREITAEFPVILEMCHRFAGPRRPASQAVGVSLAKLEAPFSEPIEGMIAGCGLSNWKDAIRSIRHTNLHRRNWVTGRKLRAGRILNSLKIFNPQLNTTHRPQD